MIRRNRTTYSDAWLPGQVLRRAPRSASSDGVRMAGPLLAARAVLGARIVAVEPLLRFGREEQFRRVEELREEWERKHPGCVVETEPPLEELAGGAS